MHRLEYNLTENMNIYNIMHIMPTIMGSDGN